MKPKVLLVAVLLFAGLRGFADGVIDIANPGSGDGWTYVGGEDNTVRIVADGRYTVRGTTETNRLVVAAGVKATVILQDVNIHCATGCGVSGETAAEVVLQLLGSNRLTTYDTLSAGLTAAASAQLTIECYPEVSDAGGQGALYAESVGGPAIQGGNIRIRSGSITAVGGTGSAGICGESIDISGGTVSANGGTGGAGIGGGDGESGRTITVRSGAQLTATGGTAGAGIGGGRNGNGGSISFFGGIVRATAGGEGASGIGGGQGGNGGTITIQSGVIIAVSNGTEAWNNPAGIGGGGNGEAGNIAIGSGAVYASGGSGPGIGGNGRNGTITISGGTVVANKIGNGNEQTAISGAKTIVLANAVNTQTFGTATALTDANVSVSDFITAGTVDVTLQNNLTIKDDAILTIPNTIRMDFNHYRVTNNGRIVCRGYIANDDNLLGPTPITGEIQQSWLQPIPTQVYTGDSIKPAVVKDGDRVLTQGIDYATDYTDNTNEGTATVTITGTGVYIGSYSSYFNISRLLSLSETTDVRVNAPTAYIYTGEPFQPSFAVFDGEKELVANVDYVFVYENNTNAGTAAIRIMGRGAYTGTAMGYFSIEPKPLAGEYLDSLPEQIPYRGVPIEIAFNINDEHRTLTQGTDYVVAYMNNTQIGTASFNIQGRGNYRSAISGSFNIVQSIVNDEWLQFSDPTSYAFRGDSIFPNLTVNNGFIDLTLGTDYSLSYANNLHPGNAVATIQGLGNFSGTANAVFFILRSAIEPEWLHIPSATYIYTGDSIFPDVTVQDNYRLLSPDTDYRLSFANNLNVGTAVISIEGRNDYTQSASITFNIAQRPVANNWLAIPQTVYTYTGEPIQPIPTVTSPYRELTPYIDYELDYYNNTLPGQASITIIGKGNYRDTAYINFTITTQLIITNSWLSLESYAFTYAGIPYLPPVTVRNANDGTILIPGTDYSLDYTDNIDAGDARVTVQGKGQYAGVASVLFRINPKPISQAFFTPIPDQPYSGQPIIPNIFIADDNVQLKADKDYSITCNNNINPGTANARITGIGNYTDSFNIAFNIVETTHAADPHTSHLHVAANPDGTLLISGLSPLQPLTIYNLQGQTLLHTIPTSTQLRLSLPHTLTPATYILSHASHHTTFTHN